jgi:galactitol-specific phosphotransferase system IIC component
MMKYRVIKFSTLIFIGMVLSFLVDSNLHYMLKLILIGTIVLPVNLFETYQHTDHTDIQS